MLGGTPTNSVKRVLKVPSDEQPREVRRCCAAAGLLVTCEIAPGHTGVA